MQRDGRHPRREVSGAPAEILGFILLALVLGAAVVRPWGLSEAVVATPAAILLVAVGSVPAAAAEDTLRQLGPTVAFLAAILLFGHLCAEHGVFDYLGALAARTSGGSPRRLLGLVVVLAATVTAVLTLDATVVLLTPVVLRTAAGLGTPARPHVYACGQLANAGSLLLPVSNLTNLLAFAATGLSFTRFAVLMFLPWLVACAVEWAALRMFFASDLPDRRAPVGPLPPVPRYALAVLAVTVSGFVLTSAIDIAPAWAAAVGCVALLLPRGVRSSVSARRLVSEANLGFCLFVLALGVVVDGVTRHGLGEALGRVVPSGTSLVELLAIAALAALLANVVNNLPATLLLVPLVAASPAAVLAMLLGVNIGPNATYAGSLATLLWRRLLPHRDKPEALQFHRFGALATPVVLLAACVCLWLAVRVVGV